MFTVISTFLKPYMGWIVGGLSAIVIGAFTWMFVDLTLTKDALADANGKVKEQAQTIAAQSRAIEAVDRVDALESRLNRVLTENTRLIMQAQGANDAIPPEVGAAFIAGSDRVLSYRGNPRAAEELHFPE